MTRPRRSHNGGPWTRAIALFVLAGLALLFGVLVTVNGAAQVGAAQRTLANGEATTARVETIEARELPGEDHGQFRYIAHVVFETQDGANATAELPQVNAESDHRVGEKVGIIYDRTDPSVVLLDRDDILLDPSIGFYGGIAIVIAGVVLVGAGFVLRVRDGRRFTAR